MGCHGNMERPRALFVAPVLPSDRGNGLAMRTGFLLEAYAKAFDVDLAIVPVAGVAREVNPYVVRRTRRAKVLDPGAPDTQFSLLSRLSDTEARLAAFRQYGRPSVAARVNAASQEALMSWVGDLSYALVHVSRLYLSSLAEPWLHERRSKPYLVLDCDEDDASAYHRLAGLERKWGRHTRAQWLEAEAQAFKLMANQWLPRFDLLLAASGGEARLLRARARDKHINVLPNTIPPSPARWPTRHASPGRRDVIFVGNMNYLPNIDAVTWFATHIWPKVRAAAPFPVRFVVVGQNPPACVAALARCHDIVVTGTVNDVEPFYRGADAAIVPIRAGGGTRIKLLESAGFGVPMVATSFGAAGTGLRHGVELLLADNENDFAAACITLLTDRTLALRLAGQAYRKARNCYDARYCILNFLKTVEAHGNFGVLVDEPVA